MGNLPVGCQRMGSEENIEYSCSSSWKGICVQIISPFLTSYQPLDKWKSKEMTIFLTNKKWQ